ncbi:MAG: YicC/YloC family endoribonuclease, partial [Oscillospiraceae bacterium]
MARSMTGYGRSEQQLDGRTIAVEIKSVNHRYFEFSSRVPRSYGYLEEKLKGLVQASVSRGKIDVFVSVVAVDGGDAALPV